MHKPQDYVVHQDAEDPQDRQEHDLPHVVPQDPKDLRDPRGYQHPHVEHQGPREHKWHAS